MSFKWKARISVWEDVICSQTHPKYILDIRWIRDDQEEMLRMHVCSKSHLSWKVRHLNYLEQSTLNIFIMMNTYTSSCRERNSFISTFKKGNAYLYPFHSLVSMWTWSARSGQIVPSSCVLEKVIQSYTYSLPV